MPKLSPLLETKEIVWQVPLTQSYIHLILSHWCLFSFVTLKLPYIVLTWIKWKTIIHRNLRRHCDAICFTQLKKVVRSPQTKGVESGQQTRDTTTATWIAYSTSTWHARKYREHKPHQRYILGSLSIHFMRQMNFFSFFSFSAKHGSTV